LDASQFQNQPRAGHPRSTWQLEGWASFDHVGDKSS